MITERINLNDGCGEAYIDTYIADKVDGYERKAILVIPGGGYGCVCSEREGEPIALAFLSHGYNAFVLKYSVSSDSDKAFPTQLIQASAAIKHIKDNADRYGINPDKVFAVGFSAGGHLAGSLGTMWHKDEIRDVIDMPFGYNKPTGVMLIYPVISADEKFGHLPSFKNLLRCENPTPEQLAMCSIEKNVDDKSSPAFILHTVNDEVVNVKNSLAVASAYSDAGVSFEMHIYPDAPHGVALGNDITKCGVEKWNNPQIAKWIENAAAWADNL